MRNIHDVFGYAYPGEDNKKAKWYLTSGWEKLPVEQLEQKLEGMHEVIRVRAYFENEETIRGFDDEEEMQAVLEIIGTPKGKTNLQYYSDFDDEELKEFAKFIEFFIESQRRRFERKKTLRK